MSIRGTLGKLTVIGIALAILGITPAMLGPWEVQGQKRTTEVEQGLVRVLPANPVAPLATIASNPPAPLSPAAKQRLLQSVLTSLREQQKANPKLNVGKLFAISNTIPIPPAPGTLMLTPTQPYFGNNGGFVDRLTFFQADFVGSSPENRATWNGANGLLKLSITAVPGKTYLLDFSVKGGAPMYVALVGGVQYSHTVFNMEMNVTYGHILVPFVASDPHDGWDIYVSSHTSWTFYAVEIIRLN